MKLKPIETIYDGHRFRSRLEARYAVFFNHIGWDWVYEHEGFKLPSGWYLPDFYFPKFNTYAEVKPKELNQRELRLCCELSEGVDPDGNSPNVVLLEGPPKHGYYNLIVNGAVFDKITPIHKDNKYHPFYIGETNLDDMGLYLETIYAASKAKKSQFEFLK